jgi:thioredoxin reductase
METYDVVVVGGGMAGLSAAVVLGRCRVGVLVVDAGRPRNAVAAHAHGYLTRDGASPGELIAAGRREVASYGGVLRADTVTAVEPADPGFLVHTRAGAPVVARRLLVTSGLVDQLPELPGLAERWGRDVIPCPFCHGWEARDRRTVVLARTPADLRKTRLVARLTDRLTVLADPGIDPVVDGVEVVTGRAAGLVIEDDRLTGVRTVDGRLVPAEVLYVSSVLTTGGLLDALGAATTETPFGTFPTVDATGATSVPGVWAAGNAVDPASLLVHAASAGSRAAQAIVFDLTAA